MDSFAFWCRPKTGEKKTTGIDFTIEPMVNINLWIGDDLGQKNVPFDFGLMLTIPEKKDTEKGEASADSVDGHVPANPVHYGGADDVSSILDRLEGISLYCPFEVEKWQFEDLKPRLNKETLGAIFNDRCRVVERNFTTRFVEVNLANSKDDRPFYLLSCGTPKFEKCNDGATIIHIDFPRITMEPDCDPARVYVRFRLNIRGDRGLIRRNDSRDRLFTSAFSREETIDLRINDYRTLGDEIREKIDATDPTNCRLGKMSVHVLLMARTNVAVESFEGLHEKRLLEGKGVWDNYLPENIHPDEETVAWHWKGDADTGDGYKIYLKLVHSVCNWATIGLYLLFLISLSVMTNALTTLLCGLSGGNATPAILAISSAVCLLLLGYFIYDDARIFVRRRFKSR